MIAVRIIDGPHIGRNFGAMVLAQLAAQGLALVVSLAVTRTLGVEPYGVFVFGFAFPAWFILFVTLGLDYVVTIDVAADRKRASAYLTAVAAIRIPVSLLTIAALWVSLQVVLNDPFARSVVFVLGIANVLSAYNATFDSQFRAHERLGYSALVAITERGIATIGVLALLMLGRGLMEISIVYVLSAAVSTALSLVLLRRRFTWFARRVDFPLVKALLRRAFPFALATLVAALMYSTGPVLMTFLAGPRGTGIFNAAFTLLLALAAPLQIYNHVILPRMSRMHHHSPAELPVLLRRTQRLFFALGLPVVVVGVLYAEAIVVGLYGGAFSGSGPVFAVLVLVLAVATASLGAGTALGATDRAALELRFGAVGAASNVVLCLVLIPPLGPTGAAWAFLAGTAVIAVLRLWATSRLIELYRVVETTGRTIAAGAVMLIALTVVPLSTPFAAVAMAAPVYVLALLATRGATREDLRMLAAFVRGTLGRPDGIPRRSHEMRPQGGVHEGLASPRNSTRDEPP